MPRPRYDLKVSRFCWANVYSNPIRTDISAETVGPWYDLEIAKLNARTLIMQDENVYSVAITYNQWQPAFFIIYRDHDYDDPVALEAVQAVEKRISRNL